MARTSYKRSSRLTGRKGPNAVGNLHPNIFFIDSHVKYGKDKESACHVRVYMDPRVWHYVPPEDDVFLSVVAGLGVDSWRERAISEVQGLRDERGPTQLGIYTRISNHRSFCFLSSSLSFSFLKLQHRANVAIGALTEVAQTVTAVKGRAPRPSVVVLRRRPVTTARIGNTSYL